MAEIDSSDRMGVTNLERRGPPAGARELDRSAMGLLMATVGRIVHRDTEVTRRLRALGVPGDDEDAIFTRIAQWVAKYQMLCAAMHLQHDEPMSTLQGALDAYRARVAYAQTAVTALTEATGKTLPGDTGGLLLFVRELIANDAKLADAEKRCADAQTRCTEIAEGFQLQALEQVFANTSYAESVAKLERENLELRDALKRADRNARRRGKR